MEINTDTFIGVTPSGPSPVWDTIAEAKLPSVRLRTAGMCDPASAGTRFGGMPLVDPLFEWPKTEAGKALTFLGQLNSNEINAVLGSALLPAATLLSFFYEAEDQRGWGFDPADGQYARVIATSAATAGVPELPTATFMFPSHTLRPELVLTAPEQWEPPIIELWEADRDGINEFFRSIEFASGPPRHRVFGWPDLVQNPMQLECQLASNGIYVGGPDGYRDPRVEGLAACAADWILLWQIDTDDDVGWTWGDVGTIYYWIRRQDLAEARFDRTWMIFQCC